MKSSPLRQTNKDEVEIIYLRKKVTDLENQVDELTQEVRIKQLEAENEQERSDCLEIMLKKLGEKDDTTEMLLTELKDENLSLADRVATLQDQLMDKDHLLRNLQERYAELEDGLGGIKQPSDDRYYEIVQEYERTREDLEQSRDLVETLERELHTRTTLYEQRLTVIERDRDDLRNSLTVEKSKASYQTLELESKSNEVNEQWSRLTYALNMIQSIYPSFTNGMRNVENDVLDRLRQLDERLVTSADMLYDLRTSYMARSSSAEEKSSSPIPRYLLEKTLRDTQAALQDALRTHEEDEARIQELIDEIDRLSEEKHSHLTSLQELEHQNMTLRSNAKMIGINSVSAVEVSDLKARLCAVESRAEKAAAEHAKMYAQNVKVIAYLESESSRLRGLGDHFRAVNSKLMSDLKHAKLVGMKVRGLEHRVTMLVESEKNLTTKLQASEKALLDRNEEFITLVRDKEGEEMERQRCFEREIAMYSDQIDELQSKLLDANRTIDNVTDKFRALEHEAKLELHQVRLKVDHLEHENLLQLRHSEELDFELKQCREELRQKDLLLSQSDVKLTLLSQDSIASSSNYERTVHDLSSELEEKLLKIQVLDQSVATLRARLVELEAQLLSKDEDITMRLIQKGDLETELQQLQDSYQSKVSENLELKGSNMLLEAENQNYASRLKSLEERYQELTDVNLRQLHEKLTKSESNLILTTDELGRVREQLETSDELLEAARSQLEEVENSLQKLQEEHIVLQSTEQVLRASNEALVEENDYARSQLQELATQLSASNQKLWTTESDLNSAIDQVQEYKHHLAMMERSYSENKLVLTSMETLEMQYVEEIHEVLLHLTPLEEMYEISALMSNSSANNSFRDILASPVINPSDTPLSARKLHGLQIVDQNARLSEYVKDLKKKSDKVLSVVSMLQTKVREQNTENEHIAKQFDLCRLKLEKSEHDREDLLHRSDVSERSLTELKEVVSKLQSQIIQITDVTSNRQLRIKDRFVDFGETLQKTVSVIMGHLDSQKLLDAHVVVSELKETVNILTVRDDFADGTDVSVLQEEMDTFDHHIAQFFSRSDNLLSLITNFMESFSAEKSSFNETVEQMKKSFEADRQQFKADIEAEQFKNREMAEDNDKLFDQSNAANEEVQRMTAELIAVKQSHSDLEDRIVQLEDEIKQSFELNHEMSESLKEAESLQGDLQDEIKGLHNEIEKKDQMVKNLQDQVTNMRKRLTDSDLQFEKVSAAIQRLKAEKEALENVRESLESELERSRSEYIAILDKFNPSKSEDNGYIFELEKLLAALSSSADQIEESFGQSELNTSGELSVVVAVTAKHDDRLAEAQKRVEQAVSRLSRIRSKCREEGRNRKLLERQHQSLSDEMKKLLKMLESQQNSLQSAEKSVVELETMLEGKDFDIKNYTSELTQLRNDHHACQEKCHNYEELLEQLKKENIKLSEDMQNKLSEIARINRSLESCESTVSRLQAELNTAKLDNQHVLLESEQRSQQLKLSNDNYQKTLLLLEQVETALARERNARHEIDAKLQLLEGDGGQNSRNKIIQLTSDLDRSKEEVRTLNHSKFVQEDRISSLEQELNVSKQQVQALESRIENILRERSSFAEEIAETKRKIQAAKENYELEKSLRLRSEAAIDALKRAQGEDMRKLNLEGLVTIRNNESESLHLLAEEEKRTLRTKIQELKMACDEKELLRQHEVHDKKKLEKVVENLQIQLTKRTNELNTVNIHLSSFRKDGRFARKQVLDVVAQITELAHKLSLDMHLGFVEGASASLDLKLDTFENASGKLPEALGLPSLLEVTQRLREYLTKYLSEHTKLRMQLEKKSDCEAERDSLRTQVNTLQEQRSLLVSQHQEEKRALQQQLLRIKSDDGEVARLLAQINNLENTLKKEKERKERAISELEDVRSEVDRLTGSSIAVRERTNVLGDEAAVLQEEVQRLSSENNLLHLELDKMNAHRIALKNTVDALDKKFKSSTEPTTPPDRRAYESSDHATSLHTLSIARYQARARAMEELANIYRQGLQALSPDGPAAKLSAYDQVTGEGKHRGGMYIKLAVGWIEKELATVRKSYDEEIRCLDAQVGELYSKVKEHQAYESEMRRQMEDYTKSFYRLAKDSQAAPMELAHLRKELDRAVSDVHVLQDELMNERKDARLRHVRLVEDLTKALEAREVALLALKRLESYCIDRHIDISGYAIFEELHREVLRSAAAEQVLEAATYTRTPPTRGTPLAATAPAAPMSSIIQGLIDADHELQEAEKRHGRSRQRPQPTSTMRSSSAARASSHLAQSYSSNVMESSLTENFLTNRANHLDTFSSRKESGSGAPSSRAPAPLSRPSSATNSYSLPTAANSSGQSYIRVAKSNYGKEVR